MDRNGQEDEEQRHPNHEDRQDQPHLCEHCAKIHGKECHESSMPEAQSDLKNDPLSLTTHSERSVLVFVGPPHDKDAKEHHAIEDPHGSTEPTNQ